MSSAEFNKYISSSEFKALLNRYESALDSGELVYFDADDIVDIAEYYHIDGDLASAEAAADYCLTLYHGEPSALLFKARMALIDYDDVETAKSFLNQVKEETESLETVYVTAEVLLNDIGVEESEKYLESKYEMYLESYGSGASSYDDDGEEEAPDFALDVAMMYCEYGYYEYAGKWMQKTNVPNDTHALEYYDTWAKIYMFTKEWEKAENMLNKVIDIDAYNINAWLMITGLQFQQAHFLDALQSVEYAVAVAPNNPEAYFGKGKCLYVLNYMEEARKCFERHLELEQPGINGEMYLMKTLMRLSRKQEAYERAKRLFEDYGRYSNVDYWDDIMFCCAFTFVRAGDLDLAMKCCKRLEVDGHSEEENMLVKGEIYLYMNEIEKAEECFGKALQKTIRRPWIMARIGEIFYDAGMYSIAYEMMKDLVEADKENDYGHVPSLTLAVLAGACKELGKKKEYINYLGYAARIMPVNTSEILGSCFPPGTPPDKYQEIEQQRDLDEPFRHPGDSSYDNI